VVGDSALHAGASSPSTPTTEVAPEGLPQFGEGIGPTDRPIRVVHLQVPAPATSRSHGTADPIAAICLRLVQSPDDIGEGHLAIPSNRGGDIG
jgi:hypothetical protein